MNRHAKDFCAGFFGPIILAAILYLLLRSCAIGASVSLIWDPSPDTNAVGYAIYYGPVGTTQPSRNDVGNVTNSPVNNLQPGLIYFFYVTAYDQARNESDPSNVINYTVPAIIAMIFVFQADEVTGSWYQRFSSPLGTNRVHYLDSFDLITPHGAVVSILRVEGQEWWREVAVVPRRFYKIEVQI